MQPMPAKNRTAMMVGAALLAVIVGAVAVWSSRKPVEQQPTQLEQLGLEPADEPTDAAPTGTSTSTPPSLTEAGTGTTGATGTTSSQGAVSTAASTVPEVHIVKPGETLMQIAAHYYGDKVYAGDIEELNQLENPSDLKAGTELKLPRPEDLRKSGR